MLLAGARQRARSFLFRLALHVAMEVGPSLRPPDVQRMASEDSAAREPQSFLLIVCTRHIVTVPPDSDGTSSAGYPDVPAYS